MTSHSKKSIKILTKNQNGHSPEIQLNGVKTNGNITDIKVKSKEFYLITQEIRIVQSLASNDVNKRNRQLRKLKRWLKLRAASSFKFNDEDFKRLWKGLYYTMWMSDKPLIQEELSENLAQLLNCFDADTEASIKFFAAFLQTLCKEWFGIDQWRIDKFLMLSRRMLRSMFVILKLSQWSTDYIDTFNEKIENILLDPSNIILYGSIGFTLHFMDIYLEELAKIADGQITGEKVAQFLKPYAKFIANSNDGKLNKHCRERIYKHLLHQSDLGRKFSDKFQAWEELGFPTTSINDIEIDENTIEDGENDDELTNGDIKRLDPRAGNVDVYIPELPVDAAAIIADLQAQLNLSERFKTRKFLQNLCELFKKYGSGEFPLGVKKMPRFKLDADEPIIDTKIRSLEETERECFATTRKLKQLSKRNRRRLLKNLNLQNADESNFEQTIDKAIPMLKLQARKRRRGSFMNSWIEEELTTDELLALKQKRKKTKHVATNVKKTNDVIVGVQKTLEKKINHEKKTNKLINNQNNKIETDYTKENNIKKVDIITNEIKTTEQKKSTKQEQNDWNEKLLDGEIEYFIPSRKRQIKEANKNLVLNPLAKTAKKQDINIAVGDGGATPATPITSKKTFFKTPTTEGKTEVKRVKISLKNNTSQNPSDYIRQVISSPDVPYDATKKPAKGLLKANLMPSPINPFYMKKIGLKRNTDSL